MVEYNIMQYLLNATLDTATVNSATATINSPTSNSEA